MVCDDFALLHDSIRAGLALCGVSMISTGSITEALRVLESQAVELIFLDLDLPGINGYEGLKQIRELAPETRIVIISGFSDRPHVEAAFKKGASGFIAKGGGTDFIATMVSAIQGASPIPSDAAEQILGGRPLVAMIRRLMTLTPKERLVCDLINVAMCNKSIAKALNLGEATVKTHVANACKKLAVKARLDISVLLSVVYTEPGFRDAWLAGERKWLDLDSVDEASLDAASLLPVRRAA
jgi:DNA-binding NarL/FixJ family response regulator